MGIAVAIFWVVFGALYVWYRALRESPGETLAGTVLCIMIVGALVLYFFTLDALLKWNLAAGIIFCSGGIVFLIVWSVRTWIEQHKKTTERKELYNQVMDIVNRETYSDDELMRYSKVWQRVSSNGWRLPIDGFEKCKPMIEEEYRHKVRYFRVYSETFMEQHPSEEDDLGAQGRG